MNEQYTKLMQTYSSKMSSSVIIIKTLKKKIFHNKGNGKVQTNTKGGAFLLPVNYHASMHKSYLSYELFIVLSEPWYVTKKLEISGVIEFPTFEYNL